jgi:4-hydroxybenzoate polyprenyltransferase/phosphoserine phosphatase
MGDPVEIGLARAEPVAEATVDCPLVVDLDGTLLKSDLLVESFTSLLREQPLAALRAPGWLLGGKAHLKQRLADSAGLDVSKLPYRKELLAYLRKEAKAGRQLVLATAAAEKLALEVAQHLGLFDIVVASDGTNNLDGIRKLAALRKCLGDAEFDYIGNASCDLAIWRHARKALVVAPERGVEPALRSKHPQVELLVPAGPRLYPLLKAVRCHQWLKNLLIFAPLVTAQQLLNPSALLASLLAFWAFSLCASAVYLLNDLLDLASDRGHPRKRRRPFAAGDLPLAHGFALIPLLLLAGVGMAALVSPQFLAVLGVYLALTTTYSFKLKEIALVDVILLAGLYTLRVVGGAAAIAVMPSFWLLAFSMFLFLGLALVKRCAELLVVREQARTSSRGRDYRVTDMHYLQSMGSASSYLAVLVIALYINSPDVVSQYTHPQMLWLICPLLLYWVSRMWLKAGRGEMHDDPLVFAVRDRTTRAVGMAMLAIAIGAG